MCNVGGGHPVNPTNFRIKALFTGGATERDMR